MMIDNVIGSMVTKNTASRRQHCFFTCHTKKTLDLNYFLGRKKRKQRPTVSYKFQSSRTGSSVVSGSNRGVHFHRRTRYVSKSSSQLWLVACTSGFGTLQLLLSHLPARPRLCGRCLSVLAQIPCLIEWNSIKTPS